MTPGDGSARDIAARTAVPGSPAVPGPTGVPRSTGVPGPTGVAEPTGMPGSPAASRPIGADRLAYVDVMRTVAVLRVVVNHALPWGWLKWFESLPVMFFVSGTLVGRSLRTRPWRAVFWGRLNRLAVPTAVYLAFAVVMKLTGWLAGTDTHLWYIWTFLGFVALSGVYRWLVQRAALVTMAVMGLLVVVLTITDNNLPAIGMAYQMAWVAGMIWADRDCEVPSRSFLVSTAVIGAGVSVASVAYWLGLATPIDSPAGPGQVTPSQLGIAMAGLGAAWLAIGMLARHQLEASMHVRGLGTFIRYLNRRLLTIYLWHLPATVFGRDLAEDLGLAGFWSAAFVLGVTFALTAAATVLLGGLEDRASAASKRVKARAEATS